MRVEGLVAVVTGGGSGMGQDLVLQLAEARCHVAFCDVSDQGIQATLDLVKDTAGRNNVRVMGQNVDVTDRQSLQNFAEKILAANNNKVHLLFANAGIASHGPMIHPADASREYIQRKEAEWDHCFNVDYFGVLNSIRVFLPHIVKQEQGYVINTSSLNGIWTWPEHGCYTAAKFAVRGLTESLLVETYAKAPHVKVACVHPGGVRTNIVRNSTFNKDSSGNDAAIISEFDKIAGLSSSEAAAWILDGVAKNQTRILVGYDAVMFDKMNRINPHGGYDFYRALAQEGVSQWDPTRAGEMVTMAKKVSILGWLRFLYNGGAFFLSFGAPAVSMNAIRQVTGLSARQVLVLSALATLVTLKTRARI